MSVTQQSVQTQLHSLLQELSSLQPPIKDTVNVGDSPKPGFRLSSFCTFCESFVGQKKQHLFLKITWVIQELSYFPKTRSVVSANDYVFSWLHGSDQGVEYWIRGAPENKPALSSISKGIQDLAKQWVYLGQEVKASENFPVEDMFWFTQSLFHPGKTPKEVFNPFDPRTPHCPSWKNTWTPVEEEQESLGEAEGFHLYSSSNCVFMGSAAFLYAVFKNNKFIVPKVFSEKARVERAAARARADIQGRGAEEINIGELTQVKKKREEIAEEAGKRQKLAAGGAKLEETENRAEGSGYWKNLFAQKGLKRVFSSMILCYTFSRIEKENVSGFQVNMRLLGSKKGFLKEKKWEKQIWIDILGGKVMMDPMPMTAACLQTASLRRALLSNVCNTLEKFCLGSLFSKELANRSAALKSFLYIHYQKSLQLEEADCKIQTDDAEYTKFKDLVFNAIETKIHSEKDFNQKGVSVLFPKANWGSLSDLQSQINGRKKLLGLDVSFSRDISMDDGSFCLLL